MNWSDWISIYAAIVASVAFGWEIIAWWLGQARIEVKVYRGVGISTFDAAPKIFIKVINHGDKDITLHNFGLKHKDNGYLVFQESAAKLGARNCHTVFRDENLVKDALYPYIAIVTDATGKEYRSKPTKVD